MDYLPNDLKGDYLKKNPYVKTTPRKWTENEVGWMNSLIEKGYSTEEIAQSMGRSLESVSAKRKRMTKKNNTYNKKHILEKRQINQTFLNYIQPKTVLDLYCGYNDLYDDYNVTKNDKDSNISANYHMDSLKCITKLYSENQKYDLIDLDPYGSAYDCFDLAIKMANKGLCITLGEMGHKRWKRLDFVERYYDIHSLEDFNSDNLVNHIIQIGIRNKKKLKVYCKKDWNLISRVWFSIEELKITKQWD